MVSAGCFGDQAGYVSAKWVSTSGSLSSQQAAERGELDKVYWLPGTGDPVDGLTKVRSDMVPLLRIMESGRFNPGSLRTLRGVDRRAGHGCV